MAKSKPIPDFDSLEEAAEFWDTHSTADFEDQWKPVEFEVDLQENCTYVALDEPLARTVRQAARAQGLSVHAWVNRCLEERLAPIAT
jgi:predicted DNA binding CopG/RHH family protein